MTVTFFREARSSAANRPSRRSRPAGTETLVEAGRDWGAARGVVATRIIFARHGLIARPDCRPASPPPNLAQRDNRESAAWKWSVRPDLCRRRNHQHLVMAAHLGRGDRGIR